MTKAELEHDATEYQRLLAEAESAIAGGLYRTAMYAALSAWNHVDGMLQYERRYAKNEVEQVKAFDLVLKIAPVLLDFRCLDQLEGLIAQKRRLAKNEPLALEERLSNARRQLADNHRLWSLFEDVGELRQDELRQLLGGDQSEWRSIAESWGAMGLVNRVPYHNSYRLTLTTRMGQVVAAKCPKCGERAEAPKSMFLEPLACPKCASVVLFVILKTDDGLEVQKCRTH